MSQLLSAGGIDDGSGDPVVTTAPCVREVLIATSRENLQDAVCREEICATSREVLPYLPAWMRSHVLDDSGAQVLDDDENPIDVIVPIT